MKNVLIIGATGFIGRKVRELFLAESDHQLTLFSRSADKISDINPEREKAIAGDVLELDKLELAVEGQDVVIWAAAGAIDKLTRPVIDVMVDLKVDRLIHMNAMGIYNEVPASVGLRFNLDNWPAIRASRSAADMIVASPLNYTIIRGAWFYPGDDRDYTLSAEGEPFGGVDISRTSIADFMLKLTNDEDLYSKTSVGIHKPQ